MVASCAGCGQRVSDSGPRGKSGSPVVRTSTTAPTASPATPHRPMLLRRPRSIAATAQGSHEPAGALMPEEREVGPDLRRLVDQARDGSEAPFCEIVQIQQERVRT
jgi:hypothetical protein